MPATPAAQKQFVVVREAAVSAARLFEAIVTPAGMMGWAPMCRSARWQHPTGARGPGVGSVRVIEMTGGMVANEKIVFWIPGRQLNYGFVPPSPFDKVSRRYEGVTAVESTGPASSRLTWAVHYDTPGALALIAPVVKPALHGLIALMASRVVRVAESSGR